MERILTIIAGMAGIVGFALIVQAADSPPQQSLLINLKLTAEESLTGEFRFRPDGKGMLQFPFRNAAGKLTMQVVDRKEIRIDTNGDGTINGKDLPPIPLLERVYVNKKIMVNANIGGAVVQYPFFIGDLHDYGGLLIKPLGVLHGKFGNHSILLIDNMGRCAFGQPGTLILVSIPQKSTNARTAYENWPFCHTMRLDGKLYTMEVINQGGQLKLTPYAGPIATAMVSTQRPGVTARIVLEHETGEQVAALSSGSPAPFVPGRYRLLRVDLRHPGGTSVDGTGPEQQAAVELKPGENVLKVGPPFKLQFYARREKQREIVVNGTRLTGILGETYRLPTIWGKGESCSRYIRSGINEQALDYNNSIPRTFDAAPDPEIVLRVKSPILGELEAVRKLSDIPQTQPDHDEIEDLQPKPHRVNAIPRSGDPKAIMKAADWYVQHHPTWEECFTDRGFIRMQMDNLDGAIADWNDALSLSPAFAQALCYRGQLRQARGQLKDALSDMQRACKSRSPKNQAVEDRHHDHLWVWLIQARAGEKAKADQDLAIYVESMKGGRDWPAPLLLFALGRISEQECFTAAHALHRTDRNGAMCKAWFYAGMKKLIASDKQAAKVCFTKCMEFAEVHRVEHQLSRIELKLPPRFDIAAPPPIPDLPDADRYRGKPVIVVHPPSVRPSNTAAKARNVPGGSAISAQRKATQQAIEEARADCLKRLYMTAAYQQAKSAVDQASAALAKARESGTLQERLDASSVYNKAQAKLRALAEAAVPSDPGKH